jgi:hypothetical protein
MDFSVVLCENGNEHSSSMKAVNFLTSQTDIEFRMTVIHWINLGYFVAEIHTDINGFF